MIETVFDGARLTMDEFARAAEILRECKPGGKYVVAMHPAAYSWERWRKLREVGSRVCRAKRMAHDR